MLRKATEKEVFHEDFELHIDLTAIVKEPTYGTPVSSVYPCLRLSTCVWQTIMEAHRKWSRC